MSAVSKALSYRKLFRNAALIAVLAPVGLLAACADTPPPAPAPVQMQAPPPAPAPVPPARG